MSSTRDGPWSWDDSTPSYSFFKLALEATGLNATLQDGRLFTIFAPSNTAFAKIQAVLTPDDNAQLKETLMRHIIPKQLDLKDFKDLPVTEKAFRSIGNDMVFVHYHYHCNECGLCRIGTRDGEDCEDGEDHYLLKIDGETWSIIEKENVANLKYGVVHGINQVL